MIKNKTRKINRVLDIIDLLNQNPDGLSAQQIAEKSKRTTRTIFRDFKTLSNDLNIKLTVKNGKWKILPGQLLPPIRFDYDEAVTIYSAMRVFLSLTNVYNPLIGNTFSKLNSILPSPLNNQIKKTISWLRTHKQSGNNADILLSLSRAWLEGQRISIKYFSILSNEYIEKILEVYLIQPVDRTHGIWVIGNCPVKNEIEMFNLARIRNVKFLNKKYTIPESFNPIQYQFPVWKYDKYNEIKKIKLKFNPEIFHLVHETIWQLTQKIVVQPDNSVIATFLASPNMAFKLFVLEFGRMVEVLEPAQLRKDVMKTAQGIVSIYQHDK